MKRILLGVGAVLAAVLLLIAILIAYAFTARPDHEGSIVVEGLARPVEVWYDSLAVPHVWAASLEDLVFAQGYLHARERLWQMELFRRVAQGRLAEIFGPELEASDRFLRVLGLWRAAGLEEEALSPEERRLLERYSEGVNAWIRTRRGALPPEFLLLRIRPEPWTPRHVVAVAKLMSMDLSSYQSDLAAARAIRRLGEQKARLLTPAYPSWAPTILEGPEPPEAPPIAAALLEAASMRRASNSWVIGGQRTRSGKPILANDMHLALRAPGLWYLMALHAEERRLDVAGMTIPGTPLVMAGHNCAVAWGYTNAMVDDADVFIERLDPADTSRYLTPDGSLPFEVFPETLHVRGRDSASIVNIRWTRHGPVLTPGEQGTAGEVLALRWTAHQPSRTARAIVRLNFARNPDDVFRAVEDFDDPHQNVVFADTAGHIGYVMGGRVPLRGRDSRPPPVAPVPGWTGEWDWTGELPFEKHPRVLDPPQGYIVTANNRQAAGAIADLIGSEWSGGFRAHRIREMIRAAGRVDADAVHRMQLDVRDALAERYRDRAVAAATRANLPERARLLAEWDLEARGDSRAAALFYTWYERLRQAGGASFYGDADPGAVAIPRALTNEVLERRALPWVEGEGARESFDSLAAAAMGTADSLVGERTWGEIHRVELAHALAAARWLEVSLGLNVGPAPHAGSPTTVNVASHDGGFPFVTRYGASQRHVVDMADVDGAGGFILPAGQSGVPFSRHYRDQFERWRSGGLWPIPLDRERARARRVGTLWLRPVSKERS
ncbi:MAG TPA: penicillin acylase family protein [Longimicrobiales bacterium]